MKKFMAILLVFVLVFAFAACNNNNEESKADTSSKAAESKTDDSSAEASSEAASEPASEPASEEESSTEPAPVLPDYLPGFIYLNGQVYGMSATEASSIRLTKINDTPAEGDVVLFTNEYGDSIKTDGETFADYAILVVEYDTAKYMYLKKQVINLDEDVDKSDIAIPADGFVVAIHKNQTKMLSALKTVKDDVEIYPCNVTTNAGFQYTIKKTDSPFEIDGVVSTEWDEYLIDAIDEKNVNWDYRQFEKDNYGITANLFSAYDDNGVYFAVVVTSANCTFLPGISDANKGNMWQYECIQFNVCDQSTSSEYMIKHAQYATDTTAATEDHVRQYGFSGSDSGETFTQIWWGGTHTTFTGKACVVRDEDNETTTYEFYLPYAEMNIEQADVASGMQFAFGLSINSSLDTAHWQNIRMRNGGGIIGMNEFTKMPVCTLE